MQFTDRLEQELRDAVRREDAERRRPAAWRRFPALRPVLVPAAGLVAAAAAAVAIVGALDRPEAERAASPPPLFGTYTGRAMGDEFRLVLVRGGFLIAGGAIQINGALEVNGTRLKFVRPSENELPAAVGGTHVSTIGLPRYLTPLQRRDCVFARSATYRWTLTGKALRLVPVRDICRARRDYLKAGELRRQGP